MIDHNKYNLFWVTEFPLFEYSEEEGRWVAAHHPFTSWYAEDNVYLDTDKEKVRSRAYDLVMNGIELASGSIRIHRADMQAQMFDMIGLSHEEAHHRFGFLLDAASASCWTPSSTARRPTAAWPSASTGWSCC